LLECIVGMAIENIKIVNSLFREERAGHRPMDCIVRMYIQHGSLPSRAGIYFHISPKRMLSERMNKRVVGTYHLSWKHLCQVENEPEKTFPALMEWDAVNSGVRLISPVSKISNCVVRIA
jgi:hypothetical protein